MINQYNMEVLINVIGMLKKLIFIMKDKQETRFPLTVSLVDSLNKEFK